jgi:hypothetical protein
MFRNLEDFTSKEYNENLAYNNKYPNDDIGYVVPKSIENVDFIIDFSHIDHVEDLHEYEYIEGVCHLSTISFFLFVL